jgi:uncharacterized protein (TIGR03643 family)
MAEQKSNIQNMNTSVTTEEISENIKILSHPDRSAEGIFSESDKDRIIQMAWEDRTPFEAIEFQFGLKEKDVIDFMRSHSLSSSFRMWRKRMQSRKTKHGLLRDKTVNRFKCTRQRNTGNKISKR